MYISKLSCFEICIHIFCLGFTRSYHKHIYIYMYVCNGRTNESTLGLPQRNWTYMFFLHSQSRWQSLLPRESNVVTRFDAMSSLWPAPASAPRCSWLCISSNYISNSCFSCTCFSCNCCVELPWTTLWYSWPMSELAGRSTAVNLSTEPAELVKCLTVTAQRSALPYVEESSSHPSSVMASATAICVCSIFSPNMFKNLVSFPSGGPLSMMSLNVVVKPIERSCFSDGTRDNAMYVAIHFISPLRRRGVRKW